MPLNKIEQKRLELIAQKHKIINLSSADYQGAGLIFPPKILNEAFTIFSKNSDYSPDPKGNLEARKAIVDFYNKHQLSLRPDQIFLTSGTSESYFHLFQLLCGKGDEVLFPKPNYPLFDHIANMAGVTIKHYLLNEQNEWQIDCENLEKQISPRTRAMVLISPNNPTGSILQTATLEKVVSIAIQHGIALIVDEVFSEFIFDQQQFPRVTSIFEKSPIPIFTLNGISKSYALPGLKLSWIISSGSVSAAMKEHLEISIDTFLAGSDLVQKMLPDIISKGDERLAHFQKTVEAKRNLALSILYNHPARSKIDFHKPAGGFYLFLKILNPKMNEEDFAMQLLGKHHIFIHPGYFYDADVGVHFLICFLQPDEVLNKSLSTLLDFI